MSLQQTNEDTTSQLTHFSELISASFHSGQMINFCFLFSCVPITLAAMDAALKKKYDEYDDQ